MNPLTTIPPGVRVALYWAGYVLGLLSQGTAIVWGAVATATPDVSMPLWLVLAAAVVGFLQTQLNLLAGSNVPSLQDAIEGDVAIVPAGEHRRDDEGSAALRTTALVVVLATALVSVVALFPAVRG